MSSSETHVQVCICTPPRHLKALEAVAEEREPIWWTINKSALPGDRVVFYMIGPMSAFVAEGIVSTKPKVVSKKSSNWYGDYGANIEDVQMLPRQIPLAEARKQCPKWGFLLQPRRSSMVPIDVASAFLRLIESRLHIVIGGVDNGDAAWLEKAARDGLKAPTWVSPKTGAVGDEVVVFVPGNGFFATALIDSPPKPRKDWNNRYGSGMRSIELIEPAISLATIRRRIPDLTWANYPRSITTPPPDVADQIRNLIRERRETGVGDLDDEELETASIDELRAAALLDSSSSATPKERKTIYRMRSQAIRKFVLRRANGYCEGCDEPAPFCTPDGLSYLEPHHTTRLADEGPDHPAHVIGLCPNCHKRAHHADDAEAFNKKLMKRLAKLEKQ